MRAHFFKRYISILSVIAILPLSATAQEVQETFNPIYTAAPILNVSPDARASGMGDMGVATSPDANSQHWNAAKYPFLTQKIGLSLSYIPWLAGLVNDVNIAYLSGYYRVDDMQSLSATLRYFSLGTMVIMDEYGNKITEVEPNEFAVDAAYSRRFGEHVGGSLTLRYIRSDITGGYVDRDYDYIGPANGFGADVGVYFQHEHMSNEYALGLSISNMGTKMSYTEGGEKYFLPTMLRLGGRYTFNIDEDNSFTGGLELSKLLVPTPPVREIRGDVSSPVIKGMDDQVSAVQGMFQSFYDAPYGASEELSEIMFGVGLEYAYRKQFFARGGYFHDSKRKGNRRYLTFGAGIKYSFLGLDVSYLYPFTVNDPLSNTLRVTLLVDINVKRNTSNRNTSGN